MSGESFADCLKHYQVWLLLSAEDKSILFFDLHLPTFPARVISGGFDQRDS
ncbi:conserved hypothetical protein [Candidatus Nitrotoga fabula]|uniref:Uncharacterized protein n=1 Tax=Candidatus Nitrotoga fabula TaxID=2182327 RepID=A0A916FAB0_9PROT|nr:conserved hypothetical protein [Candidatus Nitrotoga fabula]